MGFPFPSLFFIRIYITLAEPGKQTFMESGSQPIFIENLSRDERNFLVKRAPIRGFPARRIDGIKRIVQRGHAYLEKGEGDVILFLHGLFGGIYNYIDVFQHYGRTHRVMMPYLPMYDLPLSQCTMESLGDYVAQFMEDVLPHEEAVLVGTSTGAGASLYYGAKPGNRARGLVLCGSVGLGHTPMKLEKGIPRKNFDYIKYYGQSLFFDPGVPPDEMIQDIFQAVQDDEIVLRVLRLARTVIKNYIPDTIKAIRTPTLLLWGELDNITPIHLAREFHSLIPGSRLHIVPQCGHVVSQEKPHVFIDQMDFFLKNLTSYE